MTTAAATTVLRVDFKWRPPPEQTVTATPRLPRIVRTLALAHRIEAMIAAGELKDHAEAARVLGTTRARVAQITSLILLAPTIQEVILALPMTAGPEPVSERRLRPLTTEPQWKDHLAMCAALFHETRRNCETGLPENV